MAQKSLGLIETVGLTAGIEAADTAVKSANVKLVGYELSKGGGMTVIKLEGDVGAVKAAVDAGKAAAMKVGSVVSAIVIPRPAPGLDTMVRSKDTVGLDKECCGCSKPVAEEAPAEVEAPAEASAEPPKEEATEKEEEPEPQLSSDTVEEAPINSEPEPEPPSPSPEPEPAPEPEAAPEPEPQQPVLQQQESIPKQEIVPELVIEPQPVPESEEILAPEPIPEPELPPEPEPEEVLAAENELEPEEQVQPAAEPEQKEQETITPKAVSGTQPPAPTVKKTRGKKNK